MNEMVERVARAICIADRKDPDEDWRYGDGAMLDVALEPGKEQRWRTYERKVRAAIEALREPTEAMMDATGHISVFYAQEVGERFCYSETAGEVWRAMIDEALK